MGETCHNNSFPNDWSNLSLFDNSEIYEYIKGIFFNIIALWNSMVSLPVM